jgi:ribonuclease HII
VKGDSKFLSIAAASILAKTYRDDLMENLAKEFPQYGWEQNAGYPTLKHRKAILEHGVTIHHRLTYRFER